MRFYSTNKKSQAVSARAAVTMGLAQDGGLFMPELIPILPPSFLESLDLLSLQDIAAEVAQAFIGEEVESNSLRKLAADAINFDAPIVAIDKDKYVLELFHGPTMAFKDFGARFMARLMACFREQEDRDLVVLVATSGDTGSAVANGFFKIPGIRVVVLYPSGKVSPLQEKQLTTLGENITSVEVQGCFDDCQRLVKQAFVDYDLTAKLRLTSANSINIARLIPQSVYYIHGYAQLKRLTGRKHLPVVFSVPSGNLGNLTAGLFAKHMGLPVHKFVASLNSNDVLAQYLSSGTYQPHPTIPTISNAMDVGDPSNFARLLELYNHNAKAMSKDIAAFAFSDQQTKEAIREAQNKLGYLFDPHGAVGYLGLEKYLSQGESVSGIILETAHPAKFLEVIEEATGSKPEIPERLERLLALEKNAVLMPNDFAQFKSFLLSY